MEPSSKTPSKSTLSASAILLAIFCNILWGSAYPAIKSGYALFQIGDHLFSKILFTGVRFFAAGVMVLCLAAKKQHALPRIQKENRALVLWMALIYTMLQYIFFYIGLSHTTGSNGSIFNSTTTFMSVLLAHFLYQGDKLTLQKGLGCLVGFLGVILVTFQNSNAGFSLLGEGFILIASACFVAGSAMSKKAVQTDDPASVTGYNLLLGGAFLIIIGFVGGGRLHTPTVTGVLDLCYLALLSALAFTIWSSLLQRCPLGSLGVFNFIIPVFGTLLSAVFLKEDILHWQYLVSLILVCAGIFLVNRKKTA